MKLNLSNRTRSSLYVAFTLLAPVVAYLATVDIIGEHEVILFAAVSTAVFGLAAINTDRGKAED